MKLSEKLLKVLKKEFDSIQKDPTNLYKEGLESLSSLYRHLISLGYKEGVYTMEDVEFFKYEIDSHLNELLNRPNINICDDCLTRDSDETTVTMEFNAEEAFNDEEYNLYGLRMTKITNIKQ